MYFALCSGAEHRQLRYEPCQIELVERNGERAHLKYIEEKYIEEISKNKPGGLKGRKMKSKVVLHHANLETPNRCFVALFKLYNDLCPSNRPILLAAIEKPLRNPTPQCWFSNKSIGHNKLDTTVARMCQNVSKCWDCWLYWLYCSHKTLSSCCRWAVDNGKNWTSKYRRCSKLQTNYSRSTTTTTKTTRSFWCSKWNGTRQDLSVVSTGLNRSQQLLPLLEE